MRIYARRKGRRVDTDADRAMRRLRRLRPVRVESTRRREGWPFLRSTSRPLSSAERIELAERLWNSLRSSPEKISLSADDLRWVVREEAGDDGLGLQAERDGEGLANGALKLGSQEPPGISGSTISRLALR